MLMLLLTAREDHPDGLIGNGKAKHATPCRLPVLIAAHALVWAGTKAGDVWLPKNR
jgi:hypothetical protein